METQIKEKIEKLLEEKKALEGKMNEAQSFLNSSTAQLNAIIGALQVLQDLLVVEEVEVVED